MTLLLDLVETSRRVGATPAKLKKVRELAEYLRALPHDETETAVHYLSGETPQGRIGLGYATLQAAMSDAAANASLSTPESVPAPNDAVTLQSVISSTQVGAPAAANAPAQAPSAAEATTPSSTRALSLVELDQTLTAISNIRGAGSAARRSQALRDLFQRATPAEHEFLLRLLTGELRQGALAGVMVDAIALAADIPVARVRRAAMYAKSLGALAHIAFLQGAAALATFQLEIFSPVAPMLAQTAADVVAALSELHGEVAFEWKMDGARIQAHKAGDEVRIYTRSLNDVTAAVPEIVAVVRKLPDPTLVLDGEAITFDPSGRPQPFQITMRRFGRKLNVGKLLVDLPIRAFFFDCLYRNGRSIADLPTHERVEALAQAIPTTLQIPRLVSSSETEARAFYEAALAAGHEGVMAKALDAPYEAGNRGASWLKIKRAHTLDLVVLAAEWGHGRRTGKLSNLHLGAFDPATGEYVMLGKTFKGLTDATLEWQTGEFLAREIRRTEWTIYVRPELVVEIAFSDLQASTRYPGGLALRLARVKRYRDDKRPEEADNMDSVRRIYAAQAGSLPAA